MTDEPFAQFFSALLEQLDKLISEVERMVDAMERLVAVAEEESEKEGE